MRRVTLLLFALAAAFALVPASAVADPNNESMTFLLRMQDVNRGVAPNGDQVTLTCQNRGTACGTFSVHPKALPNPPSGEFVHTDSQGNVLGGGTWTATDLLSFEFYGCGVLTFTDPDTTIPPNFCGGALKLRVLLATAAGTFDGILTVFCIIGPQTPERTDEPPEEGITLNIPGVINFNHPNGVGNRFERLP
jgi:hypothetical protein